MSFNKVGTMLRHSVSASSAMSGQSSMFNAIRCMSSKIFVGGLSWGTNDQSLQQAFESYGEIQSAKVITDRETNRSKGFGFVEFTSDESASEAVSQMDGKDLDGRNIHVSIAQDRAPRSNYGSSNYGSGGGGSYGGGGGGYGRGGGGY